MTIGKIEFTSPFFLAPLAGYTDPSFRQIAHEWHSGGAVTEMVSAEGLARDGEATKVLLERYEGEENLIVQLFCPDVDPVRRCLDVLLKYKPAMIDINCGCPVNKVVKTGAGSAMMKNPDRIHEIVSFLVANTDLPVSVKFRLGWDQSSINYLEFASAAVDAGSSMLTLHARTRSQMYSGKADWSKIRALKEKFASSDVRIFASGDIFTGDDAIRCIEETGCDGVMCARGAIGNPFIFSQAMKAAEGKEWTVDAETRKQTMIRHLDLMIARYGSELACREMRKHAVHYVKGLEGASRARLLINTAQSRDDYLRALDAI